MADADIIYSRHYFSLCSTRGVGCLSVPAWVPKCHWYRLSHLPVGLVYSDHVLQEEHYHVLFAGLMRGVVEGGLTSLILPMGVIPYQYGRARTPL